MDVFLDAMVHLVRGTDFFEMESFFEGALVLISACVMDCF